jgi:hypothetical protein
LTSRDQIWHGAITITHVKWHVINVFFVLRLICMITREGRALKTVPPGHIDLSPLMADPAAAEVLMLARGQLNRAFRTHGLISPDPLAVGDASKIDPRELDDPAALGIEAAMGRFDESFLTWSNRIPLALAHPVLAILQQTYQGLRQQQNDTRDAGASLLKAHEFLLACLQCDQSWTRASETDEPRRAASGAQTGGSAREIGRC